jgi:hypothetical protein
MKNKINIHQFIIIAFALVVVSCNPDNFAPVVNVNLPPGPKALVPNMYLQTGTPISMYIGQTQEVLSKNKNFNVTNATIEFYENDLLKAGWINGNANDSNYYLPNFIPTPGNVYRTKISAPGFPDATAIDTMPFLVSFSALATGKTKLYNDPRYLFNGEKRKDTLSELKVSFQDNPGVTNYYRILILKTEKNGYSLSSNPFGQSEYDEDIHCIDPVYIATVDPFESLEEGQGDIIRPGEYYFSDFTFNGKLKEFSFFLPIGRFGNDTKGFDSAFVFVQHISKSAYLHVTSLINSDNGGGIFSQPTLLFTNYKNGYGILGCNSTKMQSVKMR